jgi:hypothetical protein
MSEAIEDGLFLDAIGRLDKAANANRPRLLGISWLWVT